VRTVILPAARRDILRQVGYFIDIGEARVAERFLAAVRAAIEHVAQAPRAGAPRPMKNSRLAGLRTWPVEGFDDVKVYYLLEAGDLVVVRILHGRRDIERHLSDL
jgi:plasmid stabilization system protein ParE